jgi:hypothetical protein
MWPSELFTLLAVIALAVSTWILSSPSHRPARAAGAAAENPGYYLKNAILTDYDANGDPSVRIAADRIDQIDHGNRGRALQRARRLSGAGRPVLGHARRHRPRASPAAPSSMSRATCEAAGPRPATRPARRSCTPTR